MDNDQIILMGDSIKEFTPKNFTFFKKPTYYDISEIKLEGLKKFSEIIQWGRKNPVKFCERFYGIELSKVCFHDVLDYSKCCVVHVEISWKNYPWKSVFNGKNNVDTEI